MYRKTAIVLGFGVVLSACQPTPKTVAVSAADGCRGQITAKLHDVDARISALDARQSRGYRTQNSPLTIANPLKVCASPVPFVSLCTPSPKIKSTLPSYAEYKVSQKELLGLRAERKSLLDERKSCS